MNELLDLGIRALERGWIPDRLTRTAIRRLCADRLSTERPCADDGLRRSHRSTDEQFRQSLGSGPIAPLPERANEQHYELPPEFFSLVLGPRRKYSCCLWPDVERVSRGSTAADGLAEAEDASLAATCQRAELSDGQDVLELGCGWGSLSLWMAERYPRSRITAVSNSRPQRAFIEALAAQRGLNNVRVLTADMNEFAPPTDQASPGYDRVVSVEMFEHMRNYEQLLARIAAWLRPEGKLFVHLFCHRERAYPFETTGTANWMGRYFFSGGMMPSMDLLCRFDRHMRVVRQWSWDGRHYQRTAEAWLANLDFHGQAATDVLRQAHGDSAKIWLRRWRVFFLAVAETFGYARGQEWFVSHYLLEPARK